MRCILLISALLFLAACTVKEEVILIEPGPAVAL